MKGKNFTDRTVVVTGAGRGVGKMIAAAFADEGAKVVITDINGEKINLQKDERSNSTKKDLTM